MRENLIRDKGWKLLKKLFLVAKKDGKIDFDEERILRATDENIVKLLEYVQRAWEDKILTETEKQRITFLIAKIRDDAVSLAEYDEILTKQEEDMLKVIGEVLLEFMGME